MTSLRFACFLAGALAAGVSSTPLFGASSGKSMLTPLVDNHRYGFINNSYIVVLRAETPAAVIQNHFNFLAAAHQGQSLVNDGFAIGHVEFIERDQIVRTQATQTSAPWGLARVSHRSKLTLGTFTRYEHDPSGGKGVDVYVIDTGINIYHTEFEGRAEWGRTIPENEANVDGNGHGTHCAGTIASRKYGVAKAAKVIAVKVLGSDGSGTMSDVLAGVNYVVSSALTKAARGDTGHKGSIINMSLGGGKSRALDEAMNIAVAVGIHVAVAAGNDDRDACNYSPAGAEEVITVGASTIGDERAYFSNHGKCVNVFAPGLSVVSTYIGSNTATATLSGTSMASPHTAGLLAYLLSLDKTQFAAISGSMEPQRPFGFISSLYTSMRTVLGEWAADLISVQRMGKEVSATALTTPAELRKVLLGLATKNALPAVDLLGASNLLIFNGFTD
ncbi:peptidase S8/S53 domain-containing protein [Mycena olivaceomarginata]|nr:peptidase S8/S53 domain-containing protein [Mycena olivaceomarginata]